MTNIADLNVNYGGKPVHGYTGSDRVFSELEELVGGALPDAYVNFIKSADGGHPEIGCLVVPGGEQENLVEVDWFYSIATPGVQKVKEALEIYGNLLGPRTLPIGRDGGGNQFYLLLGAQPPSVWLYLQDENEARVKLADSFEIFISQLMSHPDFI